MTSSTSTLSDSRGRNLATFRSASEWATWKVKAQAYFVRKGLYGIITDTRPTEMKQVPTTTSEKNMWMMNERVVRAQARASGVPGMPPAPPPGQMEDVGPAPETRVETAEEFAHRQVQYDDQSAHVWATLIEACEGEALTVVMDAEPADGYDAYRKLEERFGSITVNTQFLALKAFIELKQTKPVAQYVSEWKQHLRTLNEMGIAPNESMTGVMFLMSLSAKFKQFKTIAMHTQYKTEDLYQSAIEHERANMAGSDESKRSTAMQVVEKCRFGSSCSQWRAGGCKNKSHPAPQMKGNTNKNANRGTKRKISKQHKPFQVFEREDGQEGWYCSCGFYNFGRRAECRECNTHLKKGGGGGGGGKRTVKQYRARVAQLRERAEAAQAKLDDMGIEMDLDLDFDDSGDEDIDTADIAHEHQPEERDMAMAVQSAHKRVKFTVDSGASTHFVTSRVPLTDKQRITSAVRAAGGKDYKITEKGKCSGTTSAGSTLAFEAKRCNAFKQNLFSVYKAAKEGTRTVFDWDESYLEDKSTGEKIPLTRTNNGWTLSMDTDEGA